MKIFVTGAPRSGTGFAAKCLQDIGYDVQHERMGGNGTSNWQYAVPIKQPWYGEPCDVSDADIRVLLLREPVANISSIRRIVTHLPEQMAEHVPVDRSSRHKMAATAVLEWTKAAIEHVKPHYIVKTEDFLFFCEREFDQLPDRDLIGYNHKAYRWSQVTREPTLTPDELRDVADELFELNKMRITLCTTLL